MDNEDSESKSNVGSTSKSEDNAGITLTRINIRS